MKLRWVQELQRQIRPEALLAFLAALAVLIGLAGYLYLLKPPLGEMRELSEAASGALLAEGVTEQMGSSAAEQLEREVKRLRDRLYGASSEVEPDRMESWVIDRLDRLSVRRGVRLVSVSPEGRRPVLSFDELPYHVHVEAGYRDLFAWLNDVERELRPLVVKEFELNGVEDAGRVSMKLRLVSYRLREGEA